MIYVLYNPLAGNRTCEETSKGIGEIFASDDKQYIDLLSIDDFEAFVSKLLPDDQIIICGGDGTINHLINSVNMAELEHEFYTKTVVRPQ